jgi:hypothetical protein
MLQEQDEREKQKEIKPELPQETDTKWETGRPNPVDQSTSVVDQSTSLPVDHTTSRPIEQTYRSRTERIKIGVRLPAHKVEKYKLWCFINKVDLQAAIEKGMDYVTGLPGDQTTAINDLIDLDDTLNDDISIFYQKWTRNKFTDKDKKTLEEIQHLAPHVIKSGIVISVVRSKNKINSLKYCVGAIEESATTGVGPEYLEYLVRQVKGKM